MQKSLANGLATKVEISLWHTGVQNLILVPTMHLINNKNKQLSPLNLVNINKAKLLAVVLSKW